MAIILKKMALPKESKLWLFECGECHSEFLLKEDDFIKKDAYNEVFYVCNCPVCGESSGILDAEWVEKGNIKDIRKYEYEETIAITDYDGEITNYRFNDKEMYYNAVAEIGTEVFEHYRLKRHYREKGKQDD